MCYEYPERSSMRGLLVEMLIIPAICQLSVVGSSSKLEGVPADWLDAF